MSMSSELKYKIADKVVFQKVKTALGKNKSFIWLILKVLDLELVSKDLNHLVAVLHVYAGGLKFMK